MTLKEVMELGGRNLLGWLNPERDYLPTESWCVTHDLGRLWDALLRLEDATGFVIPCHMEGSMLRGLHWLTDNPDGLLFVPPGLDWIDPRFELHSLREGILAFNGLVRYRNNRWAREAGHRYLEGIRRCLRPDNSWDLLKFDYARHFPLAGDKAAADEFLKQHGPSLKPLLITHGRSIEALVCFYESTGDPLALELADRLACHHILESTNPDGTIPARYLDETYPGDRQSFQYTLCGLVLFGMLTHQSEYVERALRTYQVGLPDLVNESGWVAHDLGENRYPDLSGNPLANTESTGATIRLALWLAVHAGHTEMYDDVERLLRARIFPSQITEMDGVNYPDEELFKIEIGGWGGNDYPHAGKHCNPSGTAEIVHTLSAVYKHITARERAGLVVYLHFDYADDSVEITTERDKEATITVCPRVHDNVLIRVPGWAPRETVAVTVDGRPVDLQLTGSFARIPRDILRNGSRIVLRHALPERTTTETMPLGDTYRFRWRGDEITGISPNEWPRAFYATLEG
jgi:hypothetical protein